MGAQSYNFTPINFLLILFFLILHVSVRAQDDPCANVECGKGTCIPHKGILGYDCDCDPGWSKYEFAGFTFPPCIIPNCTVNTDCGDSSPAPPSPPPPPTPPFNPFNTCNLIWCGDGTCVANGTGYYCQCYEGSTNALNLTGLACFKPCALGVDCNGVSFGPHVTPPPPPPPSSNGTLALPPPLPPGPPPKGGSNNVSKCSSCEVFNLVLLSAAVLALFL